jgi:hypothetical protein
MASKYIGVFMGADSGRVMAVINPDDDAQLDKPSYWLLLQDREFGEPTKLLKVSREDAAKAQTMEQLAQMALDRKRQQ